MRKYGIQVSFEGYVLLLQQPLNTLWGKMPPRPFAILIRQSWIINMCGPKPIVSPQLVFSSQKRLKQYVCYNRLDNLTHGLRTPNHGLRIPSEEIGFTTRPKIKSQSKNFRYGRSKFCLPHQPKVSDFFDLCLHWVSVVRAPNESINRGYLKKWADVADKI